MSSLEYNCESVILALLAPAQVSGGKLDGVTARRHDTAAPASLDCVIVKAESGANILEGAKPREVSVTLTYASGTSTPAVADKVGAALVESIYESAVSEANLRLAAPDLAGFIVEPGSDTRREDDTKIRKRIVTIPLLAKLAA